MDVLRDAEANKLARDAADRQWAIIQRQAFLEGTRRIVAFRHALAMLPVGSEAPTAAAMKNIVKQSEELQKKIPRIIDYLGGKKAKLPKKNSPPWETTTDAVLELLSALRHVNPELQAFARNEHQFDAAKSQRLITELLLLQQLLQQLQRTF